MLHKTYFFLFALTLGLVAGCSSNTDTTSISSKIEFNYSGSQSGSFNASGNYPTGTDGQGANSTISADRMTITIHGIDWTKAGSQANFIDMTLQSDAPIVDNQTFSPSNSSSHCTVVTGFGINHSSFDISDAFGAVGGTVKLTTVKNNEIKGSFDLTLVDGHGNPLTIKDGKIDVKY